MKVSITLTADDIKAMMSRQYGLKESDMSVKILDTNQIIVECNGFPTAGFYSQPIPRGFGDITPIPTVRDGGVTTVPLRTNAGGLSSIVSSEHANDNIVLK